MDKESIIAVNMSALFVESSLGWVIQKNTEIARANPQGIFFGKAVIPHCTLFQSYVLESEIESLCQSIGAKFEQKELLVEPAEVHADRIRVSCPNGKDEICYALLDLDQTHARPWHELAIECFETVTKVEGDEHSFLGHPISAFTREYVRDFSSHKAGKSYRPHLTLGGAYRGVMTNGSISWSGYPLRLPIAKIVIAQLGNHCTVSNRVYGAWDLPVSSDWSPDLDKF